jgi:4-amino-4-deoxy-L-arabinose transferase-like glycosyltransferase
MQSHYNRENCPESFNLFRRKPVIVKVILIVLFITAVAVRVTNLKAFQAGDRQYRSALISRGYFYKGNVSIPEWRRQVAEINQQRAGILEPPIMELLVSWAYRLLNNENLWVAGFLASAFWVIGGIFLFRIVERIESVEASIFAVGYYLFVPKGVFFSTGFVPDPLMIMLFLVSIYAIIKYYDQMSKSRLITSAIFSGLAILVKPFSLFGLLGVFISLALYKKKSWKRLIGRDNLIFLGIILLPVIFYYTYGIFAGGLLTKQAQGSFLPQLLLTRSYWRDWLQTATGVVGFTPLIFALIGFPIVSKGSSRAVLVGLLLGYVLFCLLFTYHIRFGPHYHAQLIVILALPIGSFFATVMNHLKQQLNKCYWWLPVVGALVLVIIINIREIRDSLPNSKIYKDVAVAQEIGNIVEHSTKVVYIAPYYGFPLAYYGELSGNYWPRSVSDPEQALGVTADVSVEERLKTIGFSPEFFVITNFAEFNNHHEDLKLYLSENCRLFAETDQYLIYGSCFK